MTFVTFTMDTLQFPYAAQARGEGDMGDPTTDYILAHWWSVEKARQYLGFSRQAVMDALNRNSEHPQHLHGVVIGNRWYIDPDTVMNYQRRYKGR